MPRPGSHVVHPRFEERNRPAAAATMTAHMAFTRPGTGTGTFDPATGKTTPPVPVDVWSGPARVQPLPDRAQPVDFGGQLVTLHRYRVSLPYDAVELRVDDLGTVTDSTDPALAGRQLRVVDVAYSSLLLQRDCICEDNLG